jgi:hypothetical protein
MSDFDPNEFTDPLERDLATSLDSGSGWLKPDPLSITASGEEFTRDPAEEAAGLPKKPELAENLDAHILRQWQRLEGSGEEFSRDPAEEACYDIQMACWQFQTAIERAESSGRLAFIDGMLSESRKRLELLIIAVGARQAQIDEAKR